jgi:hypothetical protein
MLFCCAYATCKMHIILSVVTAGISMQHYPTLFDLQNEIKNSVKWLHCYWLGAFAKFRKATIQLCHICLSVCLFARSHGTTWLPLDGFPWSLIFQFISNISREFKFVLKSDKTTSTWHDNWLISYKNEKCCRQKLLRKSKHTFFL